MVDLFGKECDICGKQQVSKNPLDIRGKSYMENGVSKFACPACEALMKAAFEVKKDGLRKPLTKIAGLIDQRDKANRERDEALSALRGENPFAAVVVGNPKAALQPPTKGPEAFLLGYAHNEFSILKVVELGGSPPQFVVVVQGRLGARGTYNIRGGAPLLASPEIFRKAVHEASGGELGNIDLPQKALDNMLTAAPHEEGRRKKDGGKHGK